MWARLRVSGRQKETNPQAEDREEHIIGGRHGNPTPMVDWGDDGTIPLSFQTAYARCVSFAHGLFARLDANGSVDEGTRGIVIQLTFGGDGHRRGQDRYRGIAMLRSEIDGLY